MMMVSFRTAVLALAGALSLAACSQPAQQTEAPPAAEAPPPAAEAPPPAADAAQAPTEIVTVSVGGLTGSSDAGEKIFRQCQACHVVQPGVNRVGPSLHGVVGRVAGSAPGFKYSEANAKSGITWTEEQLFSYLENPRATIPGTIMAFAGLRNPQDRADVVAFLKANSPS